MLTLLLCTAVLSLDAPPMPPVNTLCPVMGNKVTPGKSPIATLRGRQYLLCCKGCDAKLAKDPGRYLKADGTPKNAAPAPENRGSHRH